MHRIRVAHTARTEPQGGMGRFSLGHDFEAVEVAVGFLARLTHAACDAAKSESISGVDIT